MSGEDQLATVEIQRLRVQLVRVAEHWGAQRNVNVKELVFRLKTAPLQPDNPNHDPIFPDGPIDGKKSIRHS